MAVGGISHLSSAPIIRQVSRANLTDSRCILTGNLTLARFRAGARGTRTPVGV